MTRHQRRKAAAKRTVAGIVRRNLSQPCVAVRSHGLVSGIYRGDRLDRARGQGVTPMTHRAYNATPVAGQHWADCMV